MATLEGLRASVRRSPYVAAVSTTWRDARTGRTVDGRGAVAVAPGTAVRMILVGGAGSTLLDAWVTRDRWRVSVPPLELVRRGGAEDPSGLPVGFLRWWFVAPFEGVAFAAASTRAEDRWLLRDRDAVVDLRLARCHGSGRRVTATRRVRGLAEQMDQCGASGSQGGPAVGDDVRYDDSTGIRVTIAVDSVGPMGPTAEAFEDPDRDGGGT